MRAVIQTTTTPPVVVLGADPRRQRSTGHALVPSESHHLTTVGGRWAIAFTCFPTTDPLRVRENVIAVQPAQPRQGGTVAQVAECAAASAVRVGERDNSAATVQSGRDIADEQFLPPLAPDHHAGLAVIGEHNRDAAGAVVVVRHGRAVGPGDGNCEQVPDLRIAERDAVAQHVAGFAVPARSAAMSACTSPMFRPGRRPRSKV